MCVCFCLFLRSQDLGGLVRAQESMVFWGLFPCLKEGKDFFGNARPGDSGNGSSGFEPWGGHCLSEVMKLVRSLKNYQCSTEEQKFHQKDF